MDIIKSKEEFYDFLNSLSSQQNDKDRVFLEKYKACILEAATITPFTEFIGIRDRPTAIFSKHTNVNKSTEELSDHQVTSECLEIMGDPSMSASEPETETSRPLHIKSEKTVNIGQPLASSRVYLTQSTPFYSGKSDVKTTSYACDNGLLPLSLDSARFLASLYALNTWKVANALPDVWFVCEKSQQGIVALGCTYDGPKSTLLTFSIEEQESTLEMDVKSKITQDQGSRKFSGGAVFSEYDIASSSSPDDEEPLDELKIQFSWCDPESMLSSPSENSDALLKISNTPGDQFSPVLSTYKELELLYKLCRIPSDSSSWSTDEESEGVLIQSDMTVSAVQSFIEEVAHPITESAEATVVSPTSDNVIFESRTDLDFLERLWKFSYNVTSFAELQFVFAEVFKAVLLRKIQPFIHRKSTSTLAGLLRQMLLSQNGTNLQEDMALKFQMLLTERRLLPCLIQLGIEKMSRDYRSFFISADLCSTNQLEEFFISGSSQLEQCLELCKLHSILELNASIMKVLRLPSSVLSTFTKTVMEVYKKDPHYQPFLRSPVFSLPLPAYSPALKSVVALCSKLLPTTWCMQQRRKNDQYCYRGTHQKSNIYMMRNEPLFRYLLNSTDSQYYSYKCTCENSF